MDNKAKRKRLRSTDLILNVSGMDCWEPSKINAVISLLVLVYTKINKLEKE
jgi:hypothetical protein